jgi:hypothetical protein
MTRVYTAAGTELASNDDSSACPGNGLLSSISMSLPAGDYGIMVEGFSSSNGAYQLNIAAAPTWAQIYSAAAQVQLGDTVTGNTATDGANIFGNAANEVVYRITLATATTLTFTTCGSSYDSFLR